MIFFGLGDMDILFTAKKCRRYDTYQHSSKLGPGINSLGHDLWGIIEKKYSRGFRFFFVE